MERKLIGLDLGSSIAACANFIGETLDRAESWKISGKQGEHPGARWDRFLSHLRAEERPTHVAYESVEMHASSKITCPNCGTIKAATGRGKGLRCVKCRTRATRHGVMNVAAAHAYGAGEGLVQLWCHSIGVVPIEIPVSAVKKAATGKGGGKGTTGTDVLRAAEKRWPEMLFRTDDAAAAAFVGIAAMQKMKWVEPETLLPLVEPEPVELPDVEVRGFGDTGPSIGPVRFTVRMAANMDGSLPQAMNASLPKGSTRDAVVCEAMRLWTLYKHEALPADAVIKVF